MAKIWKTINEYPTNKILLVDILKLMDGHDQITILDEDFSELLYKGRVEDLICTPYEAVTHELCDHQIRALDILIDGNILVSILKEVD